MDKKYFEGIGRRKESSARVRLMDGSGNFTVNEKEIEAYFTRLGDVSDIIKAFEITNHHSAAVYVSLLDFGLTGGISLLFPPNSPSTKLDAGTTMIYGQRPGEIELWIPDEFDKNEGVETFKLFATTHEADFSWMQQERVRSLRGYETPLEQLFATAYGGQATRDARPNRLPQAEEWTTVERSFILQRPAL